MLRSQGPQIIKLSGPSGSGSKKIYSTGSGSGPGTKKVDRSGPGPGPEILGPDGL